MADEILPRRGLTELSEALRRHLRLLRQYYWQAFKGGDPDFRGELAAKLRLLVCHDTVSGTLNLVPKKSVASYPLLLGVARDMGVEIKVDLDVPLPATEADRVRESAASVKNKLEGGNGSVTLGRYLDLTAATLESSPGRSEAAGRPGTGGRSRPGGRVQLTRKDVIAVWAQTHGARAEDWEHGGAFAVIRDLGVTPEAHPEVERALQETAWTILHAGEKFLASLTPEQIFRKAAEKSLRAQQDGGPSLARGIALAKLGKYDAALDDFNSVVAKDSWNPKAHYNRALVLHQWGRHAEAEAGYRECLRLDPDYLDPRYNLACLYALQGRFAESLDELTQCMACGGFSKLAVTRFGALPLTDPDFQKLREDAVYGPRLRTVLGK